MFHKLPPSILIDLRVEEKSSSLLRFLSAAAIYTIIPGLFWPYRRGRGGGGGLEGGAEKLNPRPPQKPISSLLLCSGSAGIQLSASHMSAEECGSHHGRALSVHTRDARSARLNKPQHSLICLIFHKERKSRNLIRKSYFEA